MRIELRANGPRPAFAVVPHYLWGQVAYDSEGDCTHPTDTRWEYLKVMQRSDGATVEIAFGDGRMVILSDIPSNARHTARLFVADMGANYVTCDPPAPGTWDHNAAMARTEPVRAMFADPVLAPFDSHDFWPGWKHTGLFASPLALPARCVMHGVANNDPRAVAMAASWLRDCLPRQVPALTYALSRLTGLAFETSEDWIAWYFGHTADETGPGAALFPKPDYDSWIAEVDAEAAALSL